jgi:site-specific DNA recombinase
MDVYVRVSRVGERDAQGDAYKSPDIQLEAIAQWAQNNEVQIGKVVKDEDVSGAAAVRERGLEQLIRRAEDRVSGGVLVYRIDRFGRDAVEVLTALKRLTDADARLVAVAEGLDSSTDVGRFVIGIMVTLAEYHLAMLRSGWASAVNKAVQQGKHVASRAPLGYLRADQADADYDDRGNLIRNARLVPDPATKDAVRRAFEMRADGASHTAVVDYLRQALGRGLAKSSVTGMLRNRAYLGEARGPNGAVLKGAHEVLVSENLFRRVQARAGTRWLPTGSLARQARLGGLITCAGCGHKLRVMGATVKGERVASYACAGRYAGGDCPGPAAALVRLVDDYVADRLAGAWEEVAAGAASAEEQFVQARARADAAEAALDQWVRLDAKTQLGLGAKFDEGVALRQQAVEDARRSLWELEDTIGDLPIVHVDGKPYVYEQWGDDPERDRAHLRRHIASVTLAKADPKRRRWQPIGERVEISWVGQDDA